MDNKVQINFNKGVSLKAFDNKSQKQKRIAQASNSNSFVLDSLQPAQIIKLEYSLNDGTTKTNYIAAKSAHPCSLTICKQWTVSILISFVLTAICIKAAMAFVSKVIVTKKHW